MERQLYNLLVISHVLLSCNYFLNLQYFSDFYKSEAKLWTDKNGNFTDLGKFKTFIESMGYSIKDKIPSNCRCEGTAVTNSEFRKIWTKCNFDIK